MPEFLPVPQQRDTRTVARQLDRLGARASVELAQTRAVEAIEIAKVEALGSIAQAGQVEAAHVHAAAFALAEQHPYAFPALQHLASTTSYEIAQRIHRANRRLG